MQPNVPLNKYHFIIYIKGVCLKYILKVFWTYGSDKTHPKGVLQDFKKVPFFLKIAYFAPLNALRAHTAWSKKTTLLQCFLGHACLQHYTWVAPPGKSHSTFTNSVKISLVKDNCKSADPWPLIRPLAIVHLVCIQELYVLYLIYLMHIYKYYILLLSYIVYLYYNYWYILICCFFLLLWHFFSIQMILIWFFFYKKKKKQHDVMIINLCKIWRLILVIWFHMWLHNHFFFYWFCYCWSVYSHWEVVCFDTPLFSPLMFELWP